MFGENGQAKDAPNISLNLNPKKRSGELYFVAFLGFCIQSAVLVFGGLAHYYWKFRKGGSPTSDYSYPLTLTGTIVLSIGMFICASVVEWSTEEAEWTRSPEGRKYKIHHVWLQRGRTVNDQGGGHAKLCALDTLL